MGSYTQFWIEMKLKNKTNMLQGLKDVKVIQIPNYKKRVMPLTFLLKLTLTEGGTQQSHTHVHLLGVIWP